MAYVGDMIILSRSIASAKEIYSEIKLAVRTVGLHTNADKPKMIIQSHRPRDQTQNVTIDEETIEVVEDFVYLG